MSEQEGDLKFVYGANYIQDGCMDDLETKIINCPGCEKYVKLKQDLEAADNYIKKLQEALDEAQRQKHETEEKMRKQLYNANYWRKRFNLLNIYYNNFVFGK